jgi:hypothetical protein
MCYRSQPGESCGLFAGDSTKLRHFRDEHCARNWTDPRDGAQGGGDLCECIVARYGRPDAVFEALYQAD